MIEQYLESLRAELAGADPALVQDALYDAEEYFRGEMGEAEDAEAAFSAAAERYGAPAEVADAYREAEITVQKAMAPPVAERPRSLPGRFFGVLADPRAWGALFYLLLAFATGIIYFVLTTVWLSVSAALMIVLIGIPLLLMFVPVIRAVSFMEGRFVEVMLGERMPRRPRPFNREGSIGERVSSWLTDRRTWTTLIYMVLQFPLGLIYFVSIVTFGSLFAGLTSLPITQALFGEPIIWVGEYGYMLHPAAMPLVVIAGLLGFVVLLHAIRGVGRLHAGYAKAMLVGDYADSGQKMPAAA